MLEVLLTYSRLPSFCFIGGACDLNLFSSLDLGIGQYNYTNFPKSQETQNTKKKLDFTTCGVPQGSVIEPALFNTHT